MSPVTTLQQLLDFVIIAFYFQYRSQSATEMMDPTGPAIRDLFCGTVCFVGGGCIGKKANRVVWKVVKKIVILETLVAV
jgi:hypothetical protein